jgi:hypothetical protein
VTSEAADLTPYCFLTQDNIDPIDRVERSSLAMAATIHRGRAMAELVDAHHTARLE